MLNIIRAFLVAAGVLVFSGCSISHHVAKDYDQYLANNEGASGLPATKGNYEAYRLTPETEGHRYEFRAATSGIANLWVVEFGQMLDATLRSADVQKAFNGLEKAGDDETRGNLLVFDLENYAFSDFTARVALRVALLTDNEERFARVYEAVGNRQGGKMFWGGAWATKNAVHQSTKSAVDTIIRDFVNDIESQELAAD